MRRRRHPYRGLIGGLLLGLGLALLAIVHGLIPFGIWTPWVAILLGLALGIALIFVPRPAGRHESGAGDYGS